MGFLCHRAIGIPARIAHLNREDIQAIESGAKYFPQRLHGLDEVEQLCEIVDFGKRDSGLLKTRLEIFFNALLGVKARAVEIGGFSCPQLSLNGVEIRFRFVDPFALVAS